jgi:hypothetical protein
MTKRLVDIDDEVLEEARRALGTTTLKDTEVTGQPCEWVVPKSTI